MQILPLRFIREEDKKTVGSNLYHLAKLGHLGLPVIESVVAIPSMEVFKKTLNKYLKHNFNIKDNMNNIKNELLNLPIPETLKSFEMVNFTKKSKLALNLDQLWQDLLKKWVHEIISKIERGEKNFLQLTPQLVVFSANFSASGHGFFDEDRGHAVIKIDEGQLNFQISSEIENLILQGNKKLVLPQVYYWGIEDGKVKIVKVTPFTQSSHEDKTEEIVEVVKAQKPFIQTATKVYLDFKAQVLTNFNNDGVFLNITKLNKEMIDDQLNKIAAFDPQVKIIFNPDLELNYEQSLEFAKVFLFFRNKKKMEAQIVLPQTFSIDQFLDLKREYASLGIYSKGSLKIWKQFSTVADFLNLDSYLDAGFDGAIIDLDKIAKIVLGVDGQTAFKEARIDWLFAIEKFFKEMGLSKIIKEQKSVLIKGDLAQNEELLNYFIKSGVWGVAFEGGTAGNMREHIGFLEKQALKKLPRVEVHH